MRSRLSLCLFFLSLLGACADTGCLAPRGNANALSACVATSMPAAAGPQVNNLIAERGVAYTALAAQPSRIETIPVRLDASFNAAERATVERALNEWNHVLNGHIRLEIGEAFNAGPTPTPYGLTDPRTWFIGKVNGTGGGFDTGHSIRKGAFARALAQHHSLSNGGHLVLVWADRIGNRDLNGILLHEMGHALGLGHDSRGQLMSAHYGHQKQQCVDRAAVHSLAAQRQLPFDELNWCGKAREVNAAMAQASNRAKMFTAQAEGQAD